MKNYTSLEARVENLIRVYKSRNEHDLTTVMTSVLEIIAYVRDLESRLDKRHADTDFRQSEES